jgi:heat shock protein HslJ
MNWKQTSLAMAMSLFLASACTKTVVDTDGNADAETSPPLADSSWELAEISAGNEVDTTSEAVEKGLYTLLFRADGSVAMRFDCNRGFGRWQVVEDGSAGQGAIAFTDMGVTKALCPPTSISDRVIADFAAFDRFKVAGEQLELKIEQNSVSYHWVKTDQETLIEGSE